MLQADIDCMKDHLAQSVHWHYVINAAGQAYPLRTPEEMIDILRIYNGSNDIEGIHRRRFLSRYTQVCLGLILSLAELLYVLILLIDFSCSSRILTYEIFILATV